MKGLVVGLGTGPPRPTLKIWPIICLNLLFTLCIVHPRVYVERYIGIHYFRVDPVGAESSLDTSNCSEM